MISRILTLEVESDDAAESVLAKLAYAAADATVEGVITKLADADDNTAEGVLTSLVDSEADDAVAKGGAAVEGDEERAFDDLRDPDGAAAQGVVGDHDVEAVDELGDADSIADHAVAVPENLRDGAQASPATSRTRRRASSGTRRSMLSARSVSPMGPRTPSRTTAWRSVSLGTARRPGASPATSRSQWPRTPSRTRPS